MRTTFVFALLALFIIAPETVQATGNVLLPDDSITKPNEHPSPVLPTPPTELPKADVIKPSNPTTAYPASPNSGRYSPVPPTEIDITQPNVKIPEPIVRTTAEGVSIVMPTTILKMPDMTMPPDDPNAPKPEHVIAVDVTNKNWQQSEIDEVTQHLGIAKDKVPSLCYISVNGFLMTDKGPQLFDTGGNLHADVAYDGAVKNIIGMPRIMCSVVPLGPEQGIIKQVGDKYIVELGMIQCEAPAQQKATLYKTVSMTRGTTTPMGTCVFQ